MDVPNLRLTWKVWRLADTSEPLAESPSPAIAMRAAQRAASVGMPVILESPDGDEHEFAERSDDQDAGCDLGKGLDRFKRCLMAHEFSQLRLAHPLWRFWAVGETCYAMRGDVRAGAVTISELREKVEHVEQERKWARR